MERSWDPYYKYFKEFEFNLFEIFIFLEFQQEIVDLGYIGQNKINQNVLNPGQFCVVDGLIKIVHDLPKFLNDEKFKNNLIIIYFLRIFLAYVKYLKRFFTALWLDIILGIFITCSHRR